MPRCATICLLTVLVFAPARCLPAAEPLKSVLIRDVPHVKQKPDFCGEACAEMYLRKLQVPIDQDYVFDQSGLDPALGRGCCTRELARALRQIGFRTGAVWIEVPARSTPKSLDRQFADLHSDLAAGIPSIVCMHYDDRPDTTEHFRLVLGYDAKSDEVIYHEPAEADGTYRRMAKETFIELWPLKYSAESWTLVRLRLEPGKLPSARAAVDFTGADFCQHVHSLRAKLPHSGFSIVIEKPFVVIGDESLEKVKSRSQSTVKWAVELLPNGP